MMPRDELAAALGRAGVVAVGALSSTFHIPHIAVCRNEQRLRMVRSLRWCTEGVCSRCYCRPRLRCEQTPQRRRLGPTQRVRPGSDGS